MHGWCTPGFLLRLYLLDDALHPGHQVSHHAEEAELLGRVHQLRPPAVRGVQQAFPGFYDLRLHGLDGVLFVPCVLSSKSQGCFLELLHLEKGHSS